MAYKLLTASFNKQLHNLLLAVHLTDQVSVIAPMLTCIISPLRLTGLSSIHHFPISERVILCEKCNTGGIVLTGKDRNTCIQICPSVTFFTTNFTWIDLGQNSGLCDDRPTKAAWGTAQPFKN